jgi:carbonic anhydrase/acetyltransferase-like protein (isoleucine patch superfamily)
VIREFKGKRPLIHETAYVDDAATVIGDVVIGEGSSVWPGAVIRGDRTPIRIGRMTSVQDNATLHSTKGYPVEIGDRVTIGHNCIVHGCTIEGPALIGMGAVLMNGVQVGKHCIVGAGAVLTEEKKFPEGRVIIGLPARDVKAVSEEQKRFMEEKAESYAKLAGEYLRP